MCTCMCACQKVCPGAQLSVSFLKFTSFSNLSRYSKQNMLLCGPWYDNEKPTMTTFLYPLMSSLNNSFLQG